MQSFLTSILLELKNLDKCLVNMRIYMWNTQFYFGHQKLSMDNNQVSFNKVTMESGPM